MSCQAHIPDITGLNDNLDAHSKNFNVHRLHISITTTNLSKTIFKQKMTRFHHMFGLTKAGTDWKNIHILHTLLILAGLVQLC